MEHRRWSYRGCTCCDGSTVSLSGATLNRRHFMRGVTGAAAIAVAGVGNSTRAVAQTTEPTKPYRLDVHHHLSPPTYIAASYVSKSRDPLMKNWMPDKPLQDMDKAARAVALLRRAS